MAKIITLGNGRGEVIVDDEDFLLVSQYSWCLSTKGYAVARINGKVVLLHRFLMKPPKNQQIDHINRDKLDCRHKNMRLCNNIQNQIHRPMQPHNTSGYKGVTWSKSRKKFVAQIFVRGRGHFLGHFDDPARAAKAYDEAARKYFGEFAYTNFDNEIR